MHSIMRGKALILLAALAGCASAEESARDHMEALGLRQESGDAERDLFRRIGAEPTNARLHFDNGRFLLARGRHGDLEVARIGFANASRLAPDWWKPELALAFAQHRLGRHGPALAAYIEAVERRGECAGLCYGLALAAFRAGYFGLAATALGDAESHGPPDMPGDVAAADFLRQALAEGGRHATGPLRKRLQPALPSQAVEKADSEKPDEEKSEEARPAGRNVSIDAYVIRQNRDSSNSSGINLLESLQLQFGATLVNLNYTKQSETPGVTTRERNLEVSVPSVTYALNVASEGRTAYSIEASPSVVAVSGATSRFFEGANVLIVTQSEYSSGSVERDIGIELKVTPDEITEDYADVTAMMELSNLATQVTGGAGAQVLQTEKTSAEATARIPFGRAMALGSGATMVVRNTGSGVTGLGRIPILGNLFGTEGASASRRDVLVLISVRRDDAMDAPGRIDEDAVSQTLFGKPAAMVERVARLPSQAPRLDVTGWLNSPEP